MNLENYHKVGHAERTHKVCSFSLTKATKFLIKMGFINCWQKLTALEQRFFDEQRRAELLHLEQFSLLAAAAAAAAAFDVYIWISPEVFVLSLIFWRHWGSVKSFSPSFCYCESKRNGGAIRQYNQLELCSESFDRKSSRRRQTLHHHFT